MNVLQQYVSSETSESGAVAEQLAQQAGTLLQEHALALKKLEKFDKMREQNRQLYNQVCLTQHPRSAYLSAVIAWFNTQILGTRYGWEAMLRKFFSDYMLILAPTTLFHQVRGSLNAS